MNKDKESMMNIMKHDLFVMHRTTPTKNGRIHFLFMGIGSI